ncbi:MAG: hypothetical protein E7220_06330 [Clostridiales bacterium]|nr:hypothetical protein [Clostridiales bacterium]
MSKGNNKKKNKNKNRQVHRDDGQNVQSGAGKNGAVRPEDDIRDLIEEDLEGLDFDFSSPAADNRNTRTVTADAQNAEAARGVKRISVSGSRDRAVPEERRKAREKAASAGDDGELSVESLPGMTSAPVFAEIDNDGAVTAAPEAGNHNTAKESAGSSADERPAKKAAEVKTSKTSSDEKPVKRDADGFVEPEIDIDDVDVKKGDDEELSLEEFIFPDYPEASGEGDVDGESPKSFGLKNTIRFAPVSGTLVKSAETPDQGGENTTKKRKKMAAKTSKKKTASANKKKTAAGSGAAARSVSSGSAGKKSGAASGSKSSKSGSGSRPAKAAGAGAAGKAARGKGKPKKRKIKKKRSKFGSFVRAFVITMLVFMFAGGIAGTAYVAYVISNAETIHPDQIYNTLDVSSHIYDDKERLVDEIYFSENRELSTYEELPENLKNAFIAVEDKTFWTHRGLNIKRIIGAVLERFRGGRISGTSTITQQLARNVFLPEDKSVRSIKRKITEIYYAYEIEQELSKEDILTAYLNTIYLGYGCYGVDTAARTYFSTTVENLTLAQCAALAALPQAPGTYQLLVTEKGENTTKIQKGLYANDASKDRRDMILGLMYDQGYITKKQMKKATKPLKKFIKPGTETTASKSAFKDYLIETVKKDLMKQYDIDEQQATNIIYTKGLNIYSTMDSQAQKAITKEFRDRDNFPSAVKDGVKVQGAMVVTEVGTGEVKAMVGSRKASGQMLFNRATNPRQPGSSIKPLSVYSAALQKSFEYQKEGDKFQFKNTGYDRQGTSQWGDYITTASTVIDEQMTVNGETWPQNVTRSFSGKQTFRTALQKSINTCAVKILSQVGINYSMDTLKRFGISTAIDDTSESTNDLNLAALGLGAMSEGVTPLDMSIAYATFPNGGRRNTPICYTKVEDANGRLLLEAKSETVKVLDEGVAWIMTDVLKSIVKYGIATSARVDGIDVGGKTGTTDDRYDIWFCGFTPRYSVALWIGTDKNVRMDSGSDAAARLWSKIVSNIDRADSGSYPERPSNVIYKFGDYFTTGTQPPDPPPEEKEDKKGKKGKKGEKAGKTEQVEEKSEGGDD